MAQTSIVIGSSKALKEALDDAAFKAGVSTNELARRAISAYIGYDLEAEKANKIERRGRPKVYASEADRKAAASKRARDERKQARELVDAYKRQHAIKSMSDMRKSFEKKHGSIHDE